MQRLSHFVSKQLGLLILAIGIITYFSPFYWQASHWVPKLFLGFVIFFTGLSMDVSGFKTIRYKKKELLVIILLKWVITVIISIGLAHLFFSNRPEIAAGIILNGAVPSATAAALYTFLSGGNTSLVIVASLLDIGISPVIAPLAMIGIETESFSISISSLFNSFLIIVFIPLTLGFILQRIYPQLPHQSVHITKVLSPISLLIVIHTLTSSGKEYLSNEISLLPVILLVAILQTIIPMVINYRIAKFFIEHESDAKAALFQTSVSNSALAAILAFEFFGGLGALEPILYLIINLAISAQVANYFSIKAMRDIPRSKLSHNTNIR